MREKGRSVSSVKVLTELLTATSKKAIRLLFGYHERGQNSIISSGP
jgi:hypothetical protein